MNQFETLKKELLDKAKEKEACSSEYKRAVAAESEADLLKVISDNLNWCVNNECVSHEYFARFTPEVYALSGIANTGEDNTGYSNTGDRNTGDRNTGNWNTGNWNTGDRNTGNWNTGDRNTGYSNTGDRNTGDRNTGNWNTGYRNTGDWNTGDRNTGYSNTGDRNTGNWNTGNWNTGNWNTGYSNTGDRNTGAFCTNDAPFPMFNKPSDWTEKDFMESKAYRIMVDYVDTKMWVPENAMTEIEKSKYPSYKAAGGYIKDIPFKEAFQNAWNNWNEEYRQAFKVLPNFDPEVFFEITGVKS